MSTSYAANRVLFRGATILTMDDHVPDIAKGDLLVDRGKIAALGPQIEASDVEVVDASDSIILPGFVDAHHHAWQGALRQLMPDVSSLDAYVRDVHVALGPHYRPEDHYIGNLLTALGSLDAGTTTIIDASHNARSPEHTDACLDALESAGIRALHMPGKPIAGSWAEHWPNDLARLKATRFSSDAGLITLGLFCEPNLDVWRFARQHGMRMLIEFIEPMLPMLDAVKDHLGPDTIFNHCTSLPVDTWRLFADSGVSVTVDPRSDAQYALAGGIFAWQAARDHGIRPGIGTDLETAYGGDMPTELRIAFSLQRAVAQSRRHAGDEDAPAPVKVRELLRAATIDGARCAGLDHRTGSLAPGKDADLIMIRTDSVGLLSTHNAAGAVLHAADRSSIDSVMVAGRFRKRAGHLIDVDIPTLRRRAESSVSHLFSAIGHVPDFLNASLG